MDVFVQRLIAELILPPFSLGLLGAIGLVIARRYPPLGAKVMGASILMLFLMSLPVWAVLASSSVSSKGRQSELHLAGADAIVILGGGRRLNAWEYGESQTLSSGSLERVRYGAWLSKRSGVPLLVSGGNPIVRGRKGDSSEAQIMAAVLENEFGVAVTWIESKSNDTRENAKYSSRLLTEAGVETVLLVTHYSHITRAALEFERYGLRVIPAPTVIPDKSELSYVDFLPSFSGLTQSRQLIYHTLARLRI